MLLQLFLYLFIFIDKINLFDCCYTSKLYIYCIYCIYSVFIPLFIENLIYSHELGTSTCILNLYNLVLKERHVI